jgi:hypothetical protein
VLVGSGRQQAPSTGQVSAPQVVPAPCHTPWRFAQIASVTCWHGASVTAPGGMQHAPVGGGWQIVALQAVPAPSQRPGHCDCGSIVHPNTPFTGSFAQHAPVGGGAHDVDVHTVPAPSQLPLHCDCTVTVHPTVPAEFGEQHAPVWVVTAHVVFVQVVPTPLHTPCKLAHPASVVIVHTAAPVGLLSTQHAPVFVPVCPSAPCPSIITKPQHSAPAPRRSPASDRTVMEASSVSRPISTIVTMSARVAHEHQARRRTAKRYLTGRSCPISTGPAIKSHPSPFAHESRSPVEGLSSQTPDHRPNIQHPPANHAFR